MYLLCCICKHVAYGEWRGKPYCAFHYPGHLHHA